jgi:PKD repeat protein
MGDGANARSMDIYRWIRRLVRPALVPLAVVSGLALAGLFPLLHSDSASIALACGLGNTPTMDANSAPAMLYPVVKNVPVDQPIGLFTLDYVAGQQVTFIEDLSRVTGAPPLNSFKWRWDFGDGSGYSFDVSPKHTYAKAGTYNVHAQIYDDSTAAWTDLDSAQITVIPSAVSNPPVVHFTTSTPVVAVDGSITFDASGSHAADGSQLTYQWNFNDGGTATGAHVTHTFGIQGQGLVALIVTDKRGARSVATTNVVIVNQLMTASETTAAPGDTVSFDAGAALEQGLPQGDTHIQFTWNFGDGSQPLQTQTPTASHTFTKPGQYAVQVQGAATDQTEVPPVLTAIAVTVVGPQATQQVTRPGSAAGQSWLVFGGAGAAALVILVVGFFLVQAQRRRNALIRERTAAMELARARTIQAMRAGSRGPRDPRGSRDPRRDGPPRDGSGGGPRSGGPRQPPNGGPW